MRRVVNSSAL